MKKSAIMLFIGCLAITSALCLFCWNRYEDEQSGLQMAQVVKTMSVTTMETKSMNADMNPDFELNPDMEMPKTSIDGVDYIGTLSIPVLDLTLTVASKWDYPTLKISPCRYKGSIYDNDCIIAAHNYQSHFGTISTLQVDDKITFTDIDGNEFEYQVSNLETIEKTDIDGMESGVWDLTLFTCTYGGQSRIAVRCIASEKEA